MDHDNLHKAVEVLLQAGFLPRLHLDPHGIADPATLKKWVDEKNMRALCFESGLSQIDLLVGITIPYDEYHRVNFQAGRFLYPVASKEDLIRMKTDTGRSQDQSDVQQLRILIDLENEAKTKGK
jgi:hypothetical protein